MADGFSTEGGFNQLDVQIQQRPLLGWAVMAHLSTFLVMPIAMLFPPLLLLAVPWFLAAVAFFVGGLLWRRPVKIQITRFEVQVDAYSGLPARPIRRALPLDELRWEWRSGASVNKQPTHILRLEGGDGPALDLRGLVCAPGHREILTEALTAAQARVQSLDGGDAAAVPRALNDLRAQAVEPPLP